MSDEEKEEIEQEYDSIVKIMAGIKFYRIALSTICTYRTGEQISEVFDKYFIAEPLTNPDDILQAFGSWEGIYCLELNNNYKSLKRLAEDLIVSRISGLMDKEI